VLRERQRRGRLRANVCFRRPQGLRFRQRHASRESFVSGLKP
jgi:hypothetical protein